MTKMYKAPQSTQCRDLGVTDYGPPTTGCHGNWYFTAGIHFIMTVTCRVKERPRNLVEGLTVWGGRADFVYQKKSI